jgi:DDE superfamily endonuclease
MMDLPVHYAYNAKSWMNRATFEEWFYVVFVPDVQRVRGADAKALLILDNCAAHNMASGSRLQTPDGNIRVSN